MTASEQQGEAAGAETAVPQGEAAYSRQVWLRHPELWIAVALGAILRLWGLGATQFLVDQATLMTLARDAVLRHAVPVAGLSSSIHTLNPPLSVYLLLPFALFGTNPLPAAVALALWNVLGVALCYLFALRYFGRRIAAVGSLLFAVGPTAVLYSRFLWPQNYLPPLVTLYAMAVYAGCVRGKRSMLAPAVLLLALGALLHPTALLLAPALVAGMLLAPHRPRWRDYALSATIVAVLLLPTIVWEVASGWSDLRLFTTYSSGPAKIDPEVFFRLYEALGAPGLPVTGSVPHAPPHSLAGVFQLLAAPITDPSLGAASPYAALGPLYVALGLAAILLFAVGWLALTWRVFAPAGALWREQMAQAGERLDEQAVRLARLGRWGGTIWRELRGDAAWRAYLLLWLLVTAPLVLLIRHSSAIFTHYLIMLYPFAFLTMALGVTSLAEGAVRLAGRLRVSIPARNDSRELRAGLRPLGACPPRNDSRDWLRHAPATRGLVLILVAALILGQAAQSLLYTISIATGQFDAQVSGYGYPLDALQQADARLSQLQRQVGAVTVYIAEKPQESAAMDYTLVREHADWVGFVDDCLVLPPPNAGPALVVVASDSLGAHALATLPTATLLSAIPMAGNAPLSVYRVAGAPPAAFPGEAALAPIRFQDASGQGLQLDAGRIDGKQVRLRWTVLESTPPGATPLRLRVQVHDVNAAGQISAVQAFRDCAPTRWQAGETVFMWLPVPASWSAAPGGAHEASDELLVQGEESTAGLDTPTLGPIQLLSSAQVSTPWRFLTPQPSAGPSLGGIQDIRVADRGVLVSEANLNIGV